MLAWKNAEGRLSSSILAPFSIERSPTGRLQQILRPTSPPGAKEDYGQQPEQRQVPEIREQDRPDLMVKHHGKTRSGINQRRGHTSKKKNLPRQAPCLTVERRQERE